MASDIEILRRAAELEESYGPRAWEALRVKAGRADINRLLNAELIEQRQRSGNIGPGQYTSALYRLTEKGKEVAAKELEVRPIIPAAEIIETMSLIVGFEDIKETIAYSIEGRKRIHFLLEGPPACAKSLFLDAVRNAVPDAYLAFGSRTSGRGLSDKLFEKQPSVLLMDEADKMRHDVFSLTLGLMEAGEIIETKSQNTRGLQLDTMVIAACNSSRKMPPEFLSRFAFHPKFPPYDRDEFIEIVCFMLGQDEGCPEDLARMIAVQVYDSHQGDVRQARGVWKLMRQPTEAEAMRVLRMKEKYRTGERQTNKKAVAGRLV